MLEHRSAPLRATVRTLHDRIRRWTRPAPRPSVGVILDQMRSPAELVWENALLRTHLAVACRQRRRPPLRRTDRALVVLLARLTPRWREAIRLIKPETILRWHRQGCKLLWRRRSTPGRRRPRLPAETSALIERMARNNPLWGAERVRGELLKLGIRVAKRTVQK